jgi:hypothetical protein
VDDSEVGRFASTDGAARYRVLVAVTDDQRNRANKLVRQRYALSGYARLVDPLVEGRPPCRSIVLLVEASNGRPLATATVLDDSPSGLPCDEIYRREIDELRRAGRRLTEVVRLAADARSADSQLVLLQLMAFVYVGAAMAFGATDAVIEVNPRHVVYYRRMLSFEPIGPERPCPRVGGAPAVLLRARDFRSLEAGPVMAKHKTAYAQLTLVQMTSAAEVMRRYLDRSHTDAHELDDDVWGEILRDGVLAY